MTIVCRSHLFICHTSSIKILYIYRNRLASIIRSMLYSIYITGQIFTATSENLKTLRRLWQTIDIFLGSEFSALRPILRTFWVIGNCHERRRHRRHQSSKKNFFFFWISGLACKQVNYLLRHKGRQGLPVVWWCSLCIWEYGGWVCIATSRGIVDQKYFLTLL